MSEFDMLIEGEGVDYPLFPVPSRPTALSRVVRKMSWRWCMIT